MEQIDVLKALLRDTQAGLHNYSWNTDGDPTGVQDHPEVIDEVRWDEREAGTWFLVPSDVTFHDFFQGKWSDN